MGKRHRRKAENEWHGRRRTERRVADGTIVAVPTFPETSRPGLDGRIFVGLRQLDELVRDMRIGVGFPDEIADGESALRAYFLYLSMLVDIVLADIAMSAMHRNDPMVFMKQRMLVEYATKAACFDDNRDYALYMMTVGEAEQVLRKLRDAKADAHVIAPAQRRVEDLRERFPQLAHFDRPESFGKMMRRYAEDDDVVWLYNAPSALMHGDPEGLRTFIETLPNGRSDLHIEYPIEQVNAMLVDSGRNALMFCDRFIRCFGASDEELVGRLNNLWKTFRSLVLEYPYGRDGSALLEVKSEVEAN